MNTASWLRPLRRALGLDTRRTPLRNYLHLTQFEDRLVPASTLSFQQGDANAYAGTLQVLIDNNSPNANLLGSADADGFYFLDGSDPTPSSSPHSWDLLRFDNIFGSGANQIPAGSVIRGATLKYTTGTSSNSQTGGAYSVSQMLAPFDASTTWSSLGLPILNAEIHKAGPTFGVVSDYPVGSLGAAVSTGTYAMVAGSVGVVDVSTILQNWSNDPARNYGFVTRTSNTNDGWNAGTISNPNVAARPILTVDYDPPAVGLKTVVFQQGLNGYADAVDVLLAQSTNSNTLGSTLANPALLDGRNTLAGTSPDDQMMLRFNNLFGNGPNQIPSGVTIEKAYLELQTSGNADKTSAQSNGTWAASRVLIDWNPATDTYTSTTWGGNGPTHTKSLSATPPVAGDTTSELAVLSTSRAFSQNSKAQFDVTAAVQYWLANPGQNYGLNIQDAGNEDEWQVFFSGATAMAQRPKLVVVYSNPVPVAASTADFANQTLTLASAAGQSNAISLSEAAGIVTITDNAPIVLTQAAKDQGWNGSGTNSITGPLSAIAVNTGDGDDTVTVGSIAARVVIGTGGQANDVIALTGTIAAPGAVVGLSGAGSITATASSLVNVGAGTVSIAASAIGTAALPVGTTAGNLIVNGGSGSSFIRESDGASVSGGATGNLTIENTAGTLQINVNDVLATDGNLALTSNDDLIVLGNVGVRGPSAGIATFAANADGVGAGKFQQGARSIIASQGNVSILVNTTGGGTGDALLGNTGIAGTLSVNAQGGNILMDDTLTVSDATVGIVLSQLTASQFDFQVNGAASSIGTAARPLPLFHAGASDGSGKSNASFQAGGGGIFAVSRNSVDLTVTKAVATGAGAISIATATLGTGAGHDLWISGPVTTGTGAITIRGDDNVTLNAGAVVGGPGFSGTVTIQANFDNSGAQRFNQVAGSAIITANASTSAVSIATSGTDADAADAAIGGSTLGNITVGDGGTISVTLPFVAGTDSFAGNIAQLPGTVLDAASGKVVLLTRAQIQTDLVTPAVGAGIGTATEPITVKAANVTITGVNSPVFVTGTTATTYTAVTQGRTVPANAAVAIPLATLSLATTSGALIVGGASNTDGGSITLTAPADITVNAVLGDANTGNVTVDAGANKISFNSNYTVNTGTTTKFTAGSAAILGGSTTNSGIIDAVNGVLVGAGRTLTGAGSVTGPVTVLANGTFTPAGALTAQVTTGSLVQAPASVLSVNLNGTTVGTQYDQVKALGLVDISGSILRLNVGTVLVGDKFTVVDNDDVDAVIGQFAGGTTVRGFNNPLVSFSVDYAGGDGNDVVATVTNISTASALLDVQGSQVIFFSNTGIANSVAVSQDATNYTVTESASGAKITLTPAAVTAGWSGDGTPTVTGPKAGVATLNFGLSDGADTFTALDAGAAAISISGTGTLTLAGTTSTAATFGLDEFTAVTVAGTVTAGTGVSFTGLNALTLFGTGTLTTTAGNISMNRFGDVSLSGVTLNAAAGAINLTGQSSLAAKLADTAKLTANTPAFNVTGFGPVIVTNTLLAGTAATIVGDTITTAATGLLQAPTVTLTATTSLGSGTADFNTKATTITANAPGGVFITEADGATFTATASGASDVKLTNTLGTLTLAGTTKSGSGTVTVSSKDAVALDGTLGGTGFSGKISVSANSDAAGNEGFTQSVTALLSTTNTGSDAAAITVGGTGSAVLGIGSIGGNAGGSIAVTVNKGSILWNSGFGTLGAGTLPNPVGGSNPNNVLAARNYIFTTAADGGSIGTVETPIQTANYASADTASGNSNATLVAGLGGIYLSDWSTLDLTAVSPTAAGGDIQIFSANVGGSNLFVTGTVFTGSGNIWLAGDDDLYVEGAIIGGPTFAGTVRLEANRDNGNEQRIRMTGVGGIETTNTSASAVSLTTYASDNDASNSTLGGITVGNIRTGSGGTVTLNAGPAAAYQGNIVQIRTTRIDTGEGTVVLAARNLVNGSLPASGAEIQDDLDTAFSGINVRPLQIRAKSVSISAANTVASVGEGDDSLNFTDSNGLEVSGSITGLGTLNYVTAKGPISITGPLNTDGGAITVTASDATIGGITVAAALADGNTGAITLDAGTKDIVFTANYTTTPNRTTTLIAGTPAALGPVTTISAGSTVTAPNGVTVASGRTLAGTGTLAAAATVGGTVSPGINGIGTLNTGNLAITGTLAVDLNSKTLFDQVKVAGTANITGSKLAITLTGTPAVGDTFLILDNDGVDAVTGSFTGGPDFSAVNDPRYIFSVTTTGGDGNDIVVTVTSILPTVLDVTPAGLVQYSSDGGINDVLNVDIVGTTYVVNNTATTIGLTVAAKAAGWSGSGTNTVIGPVTGVTGLLFSTSNGTDSFTKLIGGTPTTVSSFGTLTLAGPVAVTGDLAVSGATMLAVNDAVTASGAITVSGVSDVTASATSLLTGTTINLAATNGLGTATQALNTKAVALTLAAGSGGVFITEADGADVAAIATGAGNVTITNTAGLLKVAGPVTAETGAIALASSDGITVDAAIGGGTFAGTIALAANTDGVGTQGYTQTLSGSFTTINTTAAAVAITVNTGGGGTGDVILGVGSVGGAAGGTLNVQANAGSILWNPGFTFNPAAPDGGNNPNVIFARDYSFKAGNAVGTAASPIQIDAFGSADGVAGSNSFIAVAGNGGVYAWEWSGMDLTVAGATATGAGAISIVTANAGGNNIFITGNVGTGSGNIYLAANDNVSVGPNVVIGGPGFSGTVTMSGNRDKATDGQPFIMDVTSSIVTTNATADAVKLNIFGDAGVPSTLAVANITTGAGGTITLDASPEGEAGVILQQPGTKLDVGATGSVLLNARLTTGSGNVIGTATDKLTVAGGSIGFLAAGGSVNIRGLAATALAGNVSGASGIVNASTDAGTLTVAAPQLTTDGGTITLTGADGVIVTGQLGDANTGALNIIGPLSGDGTILTGNADAVVTQATASTFAGSINGNKGFVKQGAGTLTLTGTSAFTGGLAVAAGTLAVSGTVNAASSITVSAGATLGGTGTAAAPVGVAGTVNAGSATPGTLTTGNLGFITNGSVDADINGVSAIDYDHVAVVGTVNLTGAKLNVLPSVAVAVGSKFTIIDNDSTDAVTGAFGNAANEGAIVTGGGQAFSISYVGGDGNDVVLTRVSASPAVTGFTVNNGAAYRSRITSITVTFDNPVSAADFNGLGAITLTRTAVSTLATGVVGDVVQTGPAAANHITVAQGTATSLVLTFDNNGSFTNTSVGVENGSLSDGYWRLQVGSFQSGPNDLALRRLYGDSTSAANGTVNTVDLTAFGNDFNSGSPAFDFDNNGVVNSVDLTAFGNRFGNVL